MLEDFLEARASFKTKITPRVDEIPFLIRELTFKPQTSATFLKAKGKKMHFSLSAQIYSAPNYLNEATYNAKVNNRFGLKPGVSIVTIATILL